MREQRSSFPKRCDYCGTPFETDVRYPTTTEDGERGDLRIYTFCNTQCKSVAQNYRPSELGVKERPPKERL